jgi:ATP-dependent protease La (Lon)-like substrate-binding protein
MDSQRRPGRPRRNQARDDVLAGDMLSGDAGAVEESDLPGAPRDLPVLPVRNTVLLPHMVVPLFVDREPALRAVTRS